MALLIIGMFNQKVSKIKYLNKIINLAAFVIVVVFAVPFFIVTKEITLTIWFYFLLI